MSLLIFITILVALIWVHELGHFSAAKLFGIRVDEFAIGFPPRLFVVQWGETQYSFNLLLIGGFVRIFGENPGEGSGDPRAMSQKPRSTQALVAVAGIAFNILFAWVVLSAGYMAGLPAAAGSSKFGNVKDPQVIIQGVLPESPAAKAGLKEGDAVLAVVTGESALDVKTLSASQQSEAVQNFIAGHGEESMVLTVLRDGAEQQFLAKPAEGVVEGKKALGIQLVDVGILQLPPHLAVAQGGAMTWRIVEATAVELSGFLAGLFTASVDFNSVAGPIGIANVGSQAVDTGFAAIIILTALISVNLALFNLLPIPALDGWRLLILAIESIAHRPVPERVNVVLTVVGILALLTLMIVVSVNDVVRLLN